MKLVIAIHNKNDLKAFCKEFNAVEGKWWWGKVGVRKEFTDEHGVINFVRFPCSLLLDTTVIRVEGWIQRHGDFLPYRLVPLSYFLSDVLPNFEAERSK